MAPLYVVSTFIFHLANTKRRPNVFPPFTSRSIALSLDTTQEGTELNDGKFVSNFIGF